MYDEEKNAPTPELGNKTTITSLFLGNSKNY